MDTEIYILYGTFFVVIFLGLLFSLAKGLGDSKNFPKLKDKKNNDPVRASTDHDKIRKKGKFGGRDKRWEESMREENIKLTNQIESKIKFFKKNPSEESPLERMLKKRRD